MSDIGALVDYPKSAINSGSSPECIGIEAALTSNSFSVAAAWPSSNLAIFIPIKLGYIYTINKMFWLNGSTVGTNHVDVGIYDNQGNQLVHSGSTITSGASVIQSVSLTSTTLEPGLYYMAMAVDGTTDTFQRMTAAAANYFRAVGVLSQTTAFTLPSPATMIGTTTNYLPFCAVTSNSVI